MGFGEAGNAYPRFGDKKRHSVTYHKFWFSSYFRVSDRASHCGMLCDTALVRVKAFAVDLVRSSWCVDNQGQCIYLAGFDC